MSGNADAIRNVLDWPLAYYNAAKNEAAYKALDELVVEVRRYRAALEEIAATDGEAWYARSVAQEALRAHRFKQHE